MTNASTSCKSIESLPEDPEITLLTSQPPPPQPATGNTRSTVEPVLPEHDEEDQQPHSAAKQARRAYDKPFKMDVLEYIEAYSLMFLTQKLRQFFGMDRSMHSCWKKNEPFNEKAAANSRHKSFKKLRRNDRHQQIFPKLSGKICDARLRCKSDSNAWLRSHARSINKSQLNEPNATLGRSVVAQFVERYRIKIRRKQRMKAMDNERFRYQFMKWHSKFKEHLMRSNSDLDDPAWGRFYSINVLISTRRPSLSP